MIPHASQMKIKLTIVKVKMIKNSILKKKRKG